MSFADDAPNPARVTEMRSFAAERVRAQFSTEPTDEAEAEGLLRQAYAAAGLEPPRHIHWLDGPLELVAVLARRDGPISVAEEYRERVPHCVWDDAALDRAELASLGDHVAKSVDYRVRRVEHDEWRRVTALLAAGHATSAIRRSTDVWDWVVGPVRQRVQAEVGDRIWDAIGIAAGSPIPQRIRDRSWDGTDHALWHPVSAYDKAPDMAMMRYYGVHIGLNMAEALARFNEMASGYWLGRALALVVRRPTRLSVDGRGRLHHETAPCVEYRDGWGFWCWHGVRVAEHIVVTPAEELGKVDFFAEPNVEARRVIQERMGERFLWEMGMRFVDGGPRGVLYEVDIPGDPDRVARYLQVQDPSTGRDYYLRVPPRTATAAEAAAWTFGLAANEYHPTRES
jgi:Domain of unknown function (DUF6745)